MKGLKAFLAGIYVILVILLFLLVWWCRSRETVDPDNPPVKERFKADVVMCIDATGSMSNIINIVKGNALNFYDDIKRASRKQGKDITDMRIKVVVFRDFLGAASPQESLNESGFFNMPEQEMNLKKYIGEIVPKGGLDHEEIGLDALAFAMNSDWNEASDVKRVIILWTDAPTKSPQGGGRHKLYTLTDISDKWNSEMGTSKAMILFTPEDPTWKNVVSSMDNVTIHPTTGGGGLSELDYEEILRSISEGI